MSAEPDATGLTDAELGVMYPVFAGRSTMPAELVPAVERILADRMATAKAETARALGRMAELDNHHNATQCPYCSPPASVAQLATAKADALREAARFFDVVSAVLRDRAARPTDGAWMVRDE